MMQPETSKRPALSWALFDWANSAYHTIIITFIYSVYFTREVVPDATDGSSLWSLTIALAGLGVAIAGPFLAHYAARAHRIKQALGIVLVINLVATSLLWFGRPEGTTGNIVFILALIWVATLAIELAMILYNALLPSVAPAHRLGRLSGWGWGLGYLGGLAALCVVLFAFIGIGPVEPLIPLDEDLAHHVRIAAPFTALWIALFALPLFMYVREPGADPPQAAKDAGAQPYAGLWSSLKALWPEKSLIRLLIGSALYRDGLATLFAMGGVYAAARFDMGFEKVLGLAILLNVAAGAGAGLFAPLDDRLGSRSVIMLSLTALVMAGIAIILTDSFYLFLTLACVVGIFVGPVQAASRSYAARLAPPDKIPHVYALYALAGKSIAFAGPLAYSAATAAFQTQQAGMVTIILFWIAGGLVIATIRARP